MKVIINKRGEIVALPIFDSQLNEFTDQLVINKPSNEFFFKIANNAALVAQGMLVSERLQNVMFKEFKNIVNIGTPIDVVIQAEESGGTDEVKEKYCYDLTLSYYQNLARGKRFVDMISNDMDQFLMAFDSIELDSTDKQVLTDLTNAIKTGGNINVLVQNYRSNQNSRVKLFEFYKAICYNINNNQTMSSQIHFERIRSLIESLLMLTDPMFSIGKKELNMNTVISIFISSLDETLDYWSLLYTRINDSDLLHGIRNMFDSYVLAQYDGSTLNFMAYSKGERSSSFIMTKIMTRFIKGRSKNANDTPLTFKSGAAVISGIAGNGKNLFLSHLMNSFVGKKFRLDQFNSQLAVLEDSDISILSMKERAEFVFDSLPGNFNAGIKVHVNDNIINFEDLINNITNSKEKIIIINSILPFVREVESKHKGGTQKNGVKSGPIDDVLSTLNSLGQMLGKLIICTYRPLDALQQDDLIQNISAQVWLAISLHDNEIVIVDRTGSSDQMIYKNDPVKLIIEDEQNIEQYLGKFAMIKETISADDEFSDNYPVNSSAYKMNYYVEL